jgi:hypothetical protein
MNREQRADKQRQLQSARELPGKVDALCVRVIEDFKAKRTADLNEGQDVLHQIASRIQLWGSELAVAEKETGEVGATIMPVSPEALIADAKRIILLADIFAKFVESGKVEGTNLEQVLPYIEQIGERLVRINALKP